MAEIHAPKLLLVEDEKNLGSTLEERFKNEGFDVTWVTSVQAARQVCHPQASASGLPHSFQNLFQLAVLDVGLPDGSGFEVAEFLRQKQPGTGIIFLTAFGTAEDRIRGLELGAEDYVVKPFHLKELILRVKNGLKRAEYLATRLQGQPTDSTWVMVGRAKVDFLRFQAEVEGKTQALTHKEVAVLRLMVERKGCVVSRDAILNDAWSEDDYPTPRTVDNFIMRLRRLVEQNPERPEVIRSVRGIGYQLILTEEA